MNKYLVQIEKSAGISNYWDNLLGRGQNKYEGMASALKEAEATGETMRSALRKGRFYREKTMRARLGTAGGVLGIGAASLAGMHAWNSHKENRILDRIQNDFTKSAGVLSAVKLALNKTIAGVREVGSGVRYGLKGVTNTIGTAAGSGIRTLNETSGIKSMPGKVGGKTVYDFGGKKIYAANPERAFTKVQRIKATVPNPAGGTKIDPALFNKGMAPLDAAKADRRHARFALGLGAATLAGTARLGYTKGQQNPAPTQTYGSYY